MPGDVLRVPVQAAWSQSSPRCISLFVCFYSLCAHPCLHAHKEQLDGHLQRSDHRVKTTTEEQRQEIQERPRRLF